MVVPGGGWVIMSEVPCKPLDGSSPSQESSEGNCNGRKHVLILQGYLSHKKPPPS